MGVKELTEVIAPLRSARKLTDNSFDLSITQLCTEGNHTSSLVTPTSALKNLSHSLLPKNSVSFLTAWSTYSGTQ